MPTAGARSPRVSVLTAVYNGEQYLGRALESVRRQTFSDFEHVIVDDASTDDTWSILQTAAAVDSRVRPDRLAVNAGQGQALNRALALAQGEYVAIMDHDDECAPERLALQVAYLDAHPDIGVLGTLAQRTDNQGAAIGDSGTLADDEGLRWFMYYGSPLIHSSVMMRAAALRAVGGYGLQRSTIADYELWTRLFDVTRGAVLPERLTHYRRVATGLSEGTGLRQRAQMVMTIQALIQRRLGLRASLPAITALYAGTRSARLSAADAEGALTVLAKLAERHIAVRDLDGKGSAWIYTRCVNCAREMENAHHDVPDVAALCAAARAEFEARVPMPVTVE